MSGSSTNPLDSMDVFKTLHSKCLFQGSKDVIFRVNVVGGLFQISPHYILHFLLSWSCRMRYSAEKAHFSGRNHVFSVNNPHPKLDADRQYFRIYDTTDMKEFEVQNVSQ